MTESSIMTHEKTAVRASVTTMAGNIALSVFKLFAGVIGNSSAMISDAIHSAADVLCTAVVLVGVKMAAKESDTKHQYGHDRFECVAAILLSAVLFATGTGIGYSGVMKILTGSGGQLAVPTMLPLFAAIVSIAAKESMYWYTRWAAKKTDSGALMADAWHHRSDVLSSAGSFVGILGARMGFPALDPLASVVICFFVVKASCHVFMDAINKMMDTACDEETYSKIRMLILKQSGVLGIDQLKTRLFGSRIYVDIEIRAKGGMTLSESHEIAQKVHRAVEAEVSTVKHCMVRVNPE